MIRIFSFGPVPRWLFAALAFSTSACGGDEDAASRELSGDGPLYALHTVVFDPEYNATSYVALSDTVDLDSFSFDTAREFPGYAFVAAFDDKLLVSDGESPFVTRYDVSDALDWSDGERLSFEKQGVTGGRAGFERHWFRDANTAYLTLDVTSRVVWDPTNFEILGVQEDSALPLERDGLAIDATFNRQPRIHDAPLLKPFFLPRRRLVRVRADDAGRDLRSGYPRGSVHRRGSVPSARGSVRRRRRQHVPERVDVRPGALALRRGAPRSACGASSPTRRSTKPGRRISRPGPRDDRSRCSATFATARRSPRCSTPKSSTRTSLKLTTRTSTPRRSLTTACGSSTSTRETAAPVDGVGSMNSGFHSATLDGRTFVFVPTEDWSATEVYEVELDGTARLRFETTGRLTDWIRVR